MKRILFIELLGGLGDLVIALPAIHALAVSHAEAEVAVLTFPPGDDILAADPLVGRVYLAERGDGDDPARPLQAVEALLSRERFDVIVSDTTYAGLAELLQASGARAVTNLWRQPPPDQRVEERFLEILHQEGLIAPWARLMAARLPLDAADHMWAAAHFPLPGRRVLLHPHAGMPIKTWPAERFVALGRALRDELGFEIVVSEGIGSEAQRARQIVEALGPGASLLSAGSPRQFAAAAAHTDLIVGADTGPVRLAASTGVLAVVLYGPSWHGRYGLRPPSINLQGCPECPERWVADFTRQRCWYTGRCPLGHWQTCLEDIAVGDVLEAAQHLLVKTAWWGKPSTRS